MMSSEEDVTVDSFGLMKKTKRSRQRVDAGEPRNSYSSIPNFSSRPNLLNTGIYGTFFAQNQNFGFFNQGFGPHKNMLNEFLGRRMRPLTDNINSENNNMMTVDMVNSDVTMSNYDCLNNQSPVLGRVGAPVLNGGGSHTGGDNIAHHMLRNILQARKKDMFSLEEEFRAVNAAAATVDNNNTSIDLTSDTSLNNNNNINNNNNNNNDIKNNSVNKTTIVQDCNNQENVNISDNMENNMEIDEQQQQQHNNNNEVSDLKQDSLKIIDRNNYEEENVTSDSDQSVSSPLSVKEESEDSAQRECNQTSQKPDVELKKARVENIVSSIRSSPPHPTQVNGCKKRKLYHPQQHDNSAFERLASNSNSMLSDEEDENLSPTGIRQKVVEKNALKNQLRTMQEQLAEMQQKYVQLCTRMDNDENAEESREVEDEETSEADQDANSIASITKSAPSSPIPSKVPTPFTATSAPTTQPVMSPALSKMLAAKLLPQGNPHINPHSLPIHPNFNGALSFLQHQMMQEQQHVQNQMQPHHHGHHHHQGHPNHALSNAAAMYLGVSHKLFMEQEARIAKEAALMAEHHTVHPHNHQGINQLHQHQLHLQQQAMQSASNQSHPPVLHPNPIHPPQQHDNLSHQSPKRNQDSSFPGSSVKPTGEFSEKLQMIRSNAGSSQNGPDLEGLAEILKTEINTTLSNLIDTIISRFHQQRRLPGKSNEAAEQFNKDLLLASQMLDRKSPRTKVSDRGGNTTEKSNNVVLNGESATPPKMNNGNSNMTLHQPGVNGQNVKNPENNINAMNVPQARTSLFHPSKIPTSVMNNTASAANVAAAALYNSMSSTHINPFCVSELREGAPEQNEALSLVVTPKKKRHKVTDTRITPRTVSRILAQDGMICPPLSIDSPHKYNSLVPPVNMSNGSDSPPPRLYGPPVPPILPSSLPTSVAIPNPGLHESQIFSPYSPFYTNQHQPPHQMQSSSPPSMSDLRESPPLPHHSSIFHPALLAAAQQHGSSPDYMNVRSNSGGMGGPDSLDRISECNSMDGPYDGMTPTSTTLSPMHLRKAKLMFFWVRYPSSALLKMYFPDIKFHKNNTAQLVKWFSNFREFYYIQMEKYARQAVSEGLRNADDLHVSGECEIYRVLNLHYNRNNHIEVPSNFRYVVEQTLKEFFKAIQTGKDNEQSWKKAIYKVISRLDDPVPEYFKSPNFLEQLE